MAVRHPCKTQSSPSSLCPSRLCRRHRRLRVPPVHSMSARYPRCLNLRCLPRLQLRCSSSSLITPPRRALPRPQLLFVSSPGMVPHRELPLWTDLELRRLRAAQGLQRRLPVMGTRQVYRRPAALYFGMGGRLSTQNHFFVTNVSRVAQPYLFLTGIFSLAHGAFSFARTCTGQNTGYKNYDPSHPCRKCWDRFGKPFTAILASSPWGDQSSSSASQNGRTFQRPLPSSNTSPQRPVAAPVQPTPPPPPPPPRVSPRIPQQQPPPPPPGMFVPHRMPPPQSPPPPGMFVPHSMPPPRTGPAVMPYGGVPPPGAAVVMPGDSRIGGTLCLRCGGRGTTSFLIFDEMTCDSCGGIGRLLNRPPQNCSWNKQGMDPLAGPQGINGWSRRF